MKKIAIIGFITFQSIAGLAQFTENFADGDYTTNPTWTPDDVNNWVNQSNQLQSNSSVINASFMITTPSTKALNAQWEFLINLQFNTSSANFVDVYLISESANLTSATNNGYFVRIGGTTDEISLYKNTLGVPTILVDGINGVTNNSNNLIRIKVIRSISNTWTLERDDTGGTNYFLEGSVSDNSFTASNFFGMRIQQSTASFFNKHFFDDLYAGDIVVESDPPVLQTIQVMSANSINLSFNEKLNVSSSQDKSNYFANNGLGPPENAVLQPDEKSVTLTFSTDFPDGIPTELSVSGVKDLVGNVILPVTKSFLFYLPVPANKKDIIITELLPDPSPKIGLPDREFLEIYNRSSHPFDLAGWVLSDGSSMGTFPTQIILPNEYWIVVPATSATDFAPYGKVIGISNFPTLNNSGDIITLKTPSGATVDSINYSLAWYRDEDKEEGGWSLELIDPSNPCGEEDNWTASEDIKGGTPGRQNSIFANKPDLTGPKLMSVTPTKSNQILLVFDEKLASDAAKNASFQITPEITIAKSTFTDNVLREIQLNLAEELQPRQAYTLKVQNLSDCNKNPIQEEFNQLVFALPEQADSLDVIVNEILFNPRPNGVDFVEIYNNSPKYINLKNWKMTHLEDGAIKNPETIITQDFIIAPQSYTVFTQDPEILKSNYLQSNEKFFLKTNLPSLPDDEGSVAIVNDIGKIIDHFYYTEDLHSELIRDSEGVSLERISFSDNSVQNWRSATSASGFATPGFVNSNTRPERMVMEGNVSIEPEIFMPGSGTQDFSKISYAFEQPGYVANIKIVDHQGRLIKTIANNETLGYEGFYHWDGDREDGSKSRAGYYIVWFEAFSLDGGVKTFRKRVVIAAR